MNKAASSRKMLRWLTLCSILTGLILIGLFYGLEMQHIHTQASVALKNKIFDNENEKGELLPALNYVYTGQRNETDMLFAVEAAMIDDYQANQNAIACNSIRRFRYKNEEVYYTPLNAGIAGEKLSAEDGTLLLYADVSFSVNLVRRTTWLLLFALAGLSAALIVMERKSASALEQRDAEMKAFFANASHELKTPLMAICGYADGIRQGIVKPCEGLDVIEKETDRMSVLIGNILELSKVDSGAIVPQIAENDLREILYDAAGVILPAAKQQGIELLLDLPDPIMCLCDESMIFSVVSNLLTNSLRYAQSRISIEAGRGTNGQEVWIQVLNDGPSISKADAAHIFDRFYKGEKGQSGIGMSLANEYVAVHHGQISVSPVEGSTLSRVVLPVPKKEKTCNKCLGG